MYRIRLGDVEAKLSDAPESVPADLQAVFTSLSALHANSRMKPVLQGGVVKFVDSETGKVVSVLEPA
jgi:hypothetical protein